MGISRGWDHFGVDLGIILGLGIISERDHFGGCTAPAVLSLVSYITRIQYVVGFHFLHFTQEDRPFKPRINRSLALFKVFFNAAELS